MNTHAQTQHGICLVFTNYSPALEPVLSMADEPLDTPLETIFVTYPECDNYKYLHDIFELIYVLSSSDPLSQLINLSHSQIWHLNFQS